MTVYDTDALDRLAVDLDRREVVLGIEVPGPLRGARRLADALVAKANLYVAWLQSGELGRQHPETEGMARVIEILAGGPSDRTGAALVEQLAGQLRPLGIALRVAPA